MMGSQQLRRRDEQERDDGASVSGSTPPSPEDKGQHERCYTTEDDGVSNILELLEDEYTRRILRALSDGPEAASELVERCDASKPTVYRRLNRLEEHDLVAVDVELDEGGHHRKVFESTLVRVTVEFDDGSPAVHVVCDGAGTTEQRPPRPYSAD